MKELSRGLERLLLSVLFISFVHGQNEGCFDVLFKCAEFKQKGLCERTDMIALMKKGCRKTCGFCDDNEVSNATPAPTSFTKPPETSGEPVTTLAPTSPPGVTSQPSEAPTQAPAATTLAPAATTLAPEVTSPPSGAPSQPPTPVSKSTTSAPSQPPTPVGASTQPPVTPTQLPNQERLKLTQPPGAITQASGETTQAPTGGSKAPGTTVEPATITPPPTTTPPSTPFTQPPSQSTTKTPAVNTTQVGSKVWVQSKYNIKKYYHGEVKKIENGQAYVLIDDEDEDTPYNLNDTSLVVPDVIPLAASLKRGLRILAETRYPDIFMPAFLGKTSPNRTGDGVTYYRIHFVNGNRAWLQLSQFRIIPQQAVKDFLSTKDTGRKQDKRLSGYTHGCDQTCQSNCLSIHNVIRTVHNTPPMKFDQELANEAQIWADMKILGHSPHAFRQGAESLAWGDMFPTFKEAVMAWYDEEKSYDYTLGRSKTGYSIKHFLPIVWKGKNTLGCGKAVVNGEPMYVVRYGLSEKAMSDSTLAKFNVLTPISEEVKILHRAILPNKRHFKIV